MRGAALATGLLTIAACGNGLGSNDVADLGMAPQMGEACPEALNPVGLELGDTLPDVQLTDCSGASLSMQELACSKKAAYFFVYAEW